MQTFIDSYIRTLSGQFYINQVIAIVLLVIYGIFMMAKMRGEKTSVLDLILAYPLALAIYSVSGYFLLSAGIPFNRYTVIILMAVFMAGTCFLFRENHVSKNMLKKMLIFTGIMVCLAFIAVSGVIPVSATNDSMYFFSEYPRALVHYGKLTATLDNFLTDASQGIAVIGTLPFFYGFDEMFGVQTLLNIDFFAFFAYSVYEYAYKKLNKKEAYIMSGVAALMLITSMPFVLMSRWLMANAFFMEYMTIIVYMAYKYSLKEKREPADLIILSVLITGISIMRMEGALNAGVLILCIMMLGYSNKELVAYFICPVLLLQAMYLYRIFGILTLHTQIQFMTEKKAIILIAFLVFIALYILFIRGKLFIKYEKYYPIMLTMGLILVNALVLFYDSSNYLINSKAFVGNILKNSGWGLFASFVVGVLILIPKRSIKINYFDFTAICYILLTVVAGWARGDALYESFGDSGNRIMIQVVPLLLFALTVKIVEGLEYWKKENSK